MSTKKMFADLEKKLNQINSQKLTLFVGWTDQEMAKIAAIQEFGASINVTPKMRGFLSASYGINLKATTSQIVIPPRAHRKQVIEKHAEEWQHVLTKTLVKTGFDINKSLDILGVIIQQDYKSIIIGGNFTKLSDATLHMRQKNNIGGSQPLYATGEMARTIESEVRKS